MPFEVPALPYDFNALEPHIDEQTMRIHHDRHHGAYVTNLNTAVEKHPELFQKSPEALITDLNAIPEDIRTAVRNNGGGHVNHTMFWQIMGPNAGGQPTGSLASAINQTFGGFDAFKTQLKQAAVGRFGSGWGWLTLDRNGGLRVESTPNQDNPLSEGRFPVLGVDVWEHAYYLKYQNRRPDYVDAWWNTVNWQNVNQRYEQGRRGF